MLINLSNHPQENWGIEQTNAALSEYSNTEDMAFPQIDPFASAEEIQQLAQEYFYKCIALFDEYAENVEQEMYNFAVHVQGEMTFVYALVNLLRENDIKCIASTTERKSVEKDDGTKISVFRFVQFREY